jgi:hypothetical protein
MSERGDGDEPADIAVAVRGFVGETDREAKSTYLAHELRMFEIGSAEIGRPMRRPSGREADLERGMVFAGGPDEIAGPHSPPAQTARALAADPADGHRRHAAPGVPQECRAAGQRGIAQNSERARSVIKSRTGGEIACPTITITVSDFARYEVLHNFG